MTGGSGCGKTVISKIIADKGVPLYDVDVRCKDLIRNNRGLRGAIVDLFGARAYFENGDYNSKLMAGIVFNDPQQKKVLEHEVGRYMMRDYEEWVIECHKQSHPFLLVDCAYFYELEIENMVDVMVGVDAPLPIRIERLMKRDNLSADKINERLKNQMDQAEKMSNCHFVFDAGDEVIDAKALNLLLVQLSVFGQKINNLESRYRNLVAKAVAYGMGVGENKEFSGKHVWNNVTMRAGKFVIDKPETKPDLQQINDAISHFFEEYKIKNSIYG